MEKIEKIYIGGGCFWCVEAVFNQVKGVISAVSGYAGGNVENPTYEQVCEGNTRHVEVVEVEFDSSIIDLDVILKIFFSIHDPTSFNRQGADVGSQYASVVFYLDEKQRDLVGKVIDEIDRLKIYDRKIVTRVELIKKFWRAEEYHQNYFLKNPENGYCGFVVAPKVAKFRANFAEWLKN